VRADINGVRRVIWTDRGDSIRSRVGSCFLHTFEETPKRSSQKDNGRSDCAREVSCACKFFFVTTLSLGAKITGGVAFISEKRACKKIS